MKVVVTGAAGFIGSHLAEALVATGHDVVGVDSFTDYYDPARKRQNAAGLDVLELDLADADLDALLDGVGAVYHLAGQPGVRRASVRASSTTSAATSTRAPACSRRPRGAALG